MNGGVLRAIGYRDGQRCLLRERGINGALDGQITEDHRSIAELEGW